MGRLIDLTGQKFGRLTVIRRVENKGKKVMWLCKCDCGGEKIAGGRVMRRGQLKTCGCFDKERIIKGGGSAGNKLYRLRSYMITRCYNKKAINYKYYGGRGITICDEWLNDFDSFESWCIDNGWKEGLQIDRIDTNGNYDPSNCRFVTSRRNNLNKRVRSTNTSGYEGIGYHKRDCVFTSRIMVKGKMVNILRCYTLKGAVEARNNYILKNGLKCEYDIQEWGGEQ